MIKAEIVADSLSPQGDRWTSLLITFPRIILSEVNTHRMLSKNTSSSRAIPFSKMLKSIIDDPFIPIAWQKDHKGMQGAEYLDIAKKYTFNEISDLLHQKLVSNFKNENNEWDEEYLDIDKVLNEYVIPLLLSSNEGFTIVEWWLKIRDLVIACAIMLHSFGVTKQLCNRLLEPWMWTTMLISGPKEGWNNFFNLRCPNYKFESEDGFKSWKEVNKKYIKFGLSSVSQLYKLEHNKGQAEIHMMDLAEKIYDAMQESIPKQLKAGEWHIPFGDKINISHSFNNKDNDLDFHKSRTMFIVDNDSIIYAPSGTALSHSEYFGASNILDKVRGFILNDSVYTYINDFKPIVSEVVKNKLTNYRLYAGVRDGINYKYGDIPTEVKISTAMAARTSYTIIGDDKGVNYEKMIDLHDKLVNTTPPHSSPFEHCARAMSNTEYELFAKLTRSTSKNQSGNKIIPCSLKKEGWCNNAKGFIPYRYLIDNKINL